MVLPAAPPGSGFSDHGDMDLKVHVAQTAKRFDDQEVMVPKGGIFEPTSHK